MSEVSKVVDIIFGQKCITLVLEPLVLDTVVGIS